MLINDNMLYVLKKSRNRVTCRSQNLFYPDTSGKMDPFLKTLVDANKRADHLLVKLFIRFRARSFTRFFVRSFSPESARWTTRPFGCPIAQLVVCSLVPPFGRSFAFLVCSVAPLFALFC